MNVEKNETPDIDPNFNTLVERLKEVDSYEAKALLKELEGYKERAMHLVTGKPTKHQVERAKVKEREKEYITKLAFVDGDTKNGPKEEVVLTEEQMSEIEDIGTNFHYMDDNVFALKLFKGGYKIPVKFFDGIMGNLLINFNPETGDIRAIFSKNCLRPKIKSAAA